MCLAASFSQSKTVSSLIDPFDPVDGSQAVPLRQPGQALQDSLLGMMATVEHGAFGLHKGLATGCALIALRAPLGPTELDDVAVIHLAVIWTISVPTEGTARSQSWVFH